jgi:hypothetical protein
VIAPTAHATAITAAAKAIRRPRYLMATVSDEELAELAVREYYKALPPRRNRGRRRPLQQDEAAELQQAA